MGIENYDQLVVTSEWRCTKTNIFCIHPMVNQLVFVNREKNKYTEIKQNQL
jgi:hypothetical protein